MSIITNTIAGLAARFDDWANALTGVGLALGDKTQYMAPIPTAPLDAETLRTMHSNDDIAARIVDEMPDKAMRQGFDLETEGDEEEEDPADANGEAKEIFQECDRLGVVAKFNEADKWGRLYGFGGIMLGVEGGGKPDTPLDDETATAIPWLLVVDRTEMQPESYYTDQASEKFGEVEFYRIQPSATVSGAGIAASMRVHESRVIVFGGALTSRRDRQQNGGCDHSVLQRVYPILRAANQNWASVCALMADMSQALFKINGLTKAIAADKEKDVIARMQLMQMTRSVSRAIVLDSEKEDFERKATPMTGVVEVLGETWKRLAAAAQMPLTVLMGVSPAGLNATGESDIRLWYDRIQEHQHKVLTPRLLRLVRLISRSLGHADPMAWQIVWPSLWQMTAPEQADYRLKTTQADQIEIDKGVVLPEEVAITRYGSGEEYNGGRLKIDIQTRKDALKAALDEILNPPPPPPVIAPPPKPAGILPPADAPAVDDAQQVAA